MDWISSHETAIRASCFLGTLALMLCLEVKYPERQTNFPFSNLKRKAINVLLTLLNSLVVRLIPGMTAVAAAVFAAQAELGLLNIISLPTYLEIIMTIIVFDAAIYFQHVLFHKSAFLWKIHRVHHCDKALDATTALRFHPIEIILSMIYKSVLVILIGAPVVAIIVFEALLNASAVFNHANLRLPKGVDSMLRLLIVTPNMHSTHHSPNKEQTDSNYGFFLSLWDRIFGTYIRYNDKTNDIGLREYQNQDTNKLLSLIGMPFVEPDKQSQ